MRSLKVSVPGTARTTNHPGKSTSAAHKQQQRACMRSLKVSVPVTERTTPNTARSARSGLSPPRNGRPLSAATQSLADWGARRGWG